MFSNEGKKYRNIMRVALLFAIMWIPLIVLWIILGSKLEFLIWFILIGIAINFASYWLSEKVVIAIMNAREVTEEEEPVLYSVVREISARLEKPMPAIYVAPYSSPNSFATGRSERHAVLCCTRGLLNILNERELHSVVSHELMHVYNNDIFVSALASSMAAIVSYFGYWLMYVGETRARIYKNRWDKRDSSRGDNSRGDNPSRSGYRGDNPSGDNPNVGSSSADNSDSDSSDAGVVKSNSDKQKSKTAEKLRDILKFHAFGIVTIIGKCLSCVFGSLGALFIKLVLSKNREFSADEDASKLMGDPSALASALNKIAYVSELHKMDFGAGSHIMASIMIIDPYEKRSTMFSRFFSVHTSSDDRIEKLMHMENELHLSV